MRHKRTYIHTHSHTVLSPHTRRILRSVHDTQIVLHRRAGDGGGVVAVWGPPQRCTAYMCSANTRTSATIQTYRAVYNSNEATTIYVIIIVIIAKLSLSSLPLSLSLALFLSDLAGHVYVHVRAYSTTNEYVNIGLCLAVSEENHTIGPAHSASVAFYLVRFALAKINIK